MKNVPHTVTDSAIATIRERIEGGVYPVGSLLPAQRQLSEELAISRASLREALSTLEALGLLMIRPGKGVYVESAQVSSSESMAFRRTVFPAGYVSDALCARRLRCAHGGAGRQRH